MRMFFHSFESLWLGLYLHVPNYLTMFYFLQILYRATMWISNNLLKNVRKITKKMLLLKFLSHLLILVCSTAHLPHPSSSSSTLYTVCGSSGSSHPPHHVQFGSDAPDAALPPQHHLPDAHLLQHQPTAQDLVETAHHHREVLSAKFVFFCRYLVGLYRANLECNKNYNWYNNATNSCFFDNNLLSLIKEQ